MNLVLKIIASFSITILMVLAGIFCYQGIQTQSSGCHNNTESVWCGEILIHGTVISGAILEIFSAVLLLATLLFFIKPVFKLINNLKLLFKSPPPRFRNKITILNPIQLALSAGIIHPRIP